MTDDVELLAEVHRLVDLVVSAVRRRHRRIPALGSSKWWKASDEAKVAALLVRAEADVLRSPEQIADDRLKALACDLSEAADWSELAGHPSHAELQRLRYPPDGDVERWVRGEVA